MSKVIVQSNFGTILLAVSLRVRVWRTAAPSVQSKGVERLTSVVAQFNGCGAPGLEEMAASAVSVRRERCNQQGNQCPPTDDGLEIAE